MITRGMFLFGVNVFNCFIVSSVEANSIHDILEDIFITKNYNTRVRPVISWTTPTVVNVSLSVIALIEFNEVKESITITGKLHLAWIDEYLRWNPADYDNVSRIHVLQSDVWTPYLFLENSIDKQTELGSPSLQVMISSDGNVEWNPVESFHATCAVDVQKFPFDTQKCELTFESFGYTSEEITIKSIVNHVVFHEYGGTSGWAIIDTHLGTAVEDESVHIVCSLVLKRNPAYFVLNIFLPISLRSVLNICVFILPVQSGEKVSFVVTVFLSLTVFLTIVSGNLPENSDICVLNIYVFSSTLLSTIIAIVTILEIRLHNRDQDQRVPSWLMKMTILCSSVNITSRNRVEYNTTLPEKIGNVIDLVDSDANHNNDTLATKSPVKEPMHVSWPEVVKALDNIFFVTFLAINLIITISILTLTVKSDIPKIEEH